MNKLLLLSFALLVVSNNAISSEHEEVILYGNLLTAAVNNQTEVKLKNLSEYKIIKQFLSNNKCPGYKYRAYIVGPQEKQYIYLVASKRKDVIIGRHFKAPYHSDSVEVAKFESSTNGCLNLGKVQPNVAAMFASHLKPFPNEFHLLQSNLKSFVLYISTKSGLFKLENGTINITEN